MTIDPKMKEFFFDRPKVKAAVSDGEARALSKGGAFVRRRAISILRRRKRVSAPGEAPSVHAPSGAFASLKNIIFAFEQFARSVVIGPQKANQVGQVNGRISAGTVPGLMEFGGTAQIQEVQGASGTWYRRDRRRALRPGQVVRTRAAQYAPRPFMGPALEAEIAAGTIAQAWAGCVKGAA